MPHVDEGQLHAYLDRGPGDATAPEWAAFESHLAVCEDCQARLEEARRIRDRAHEILASVGPADIEVPPFESLLARSAASKEPGSDDGERGDGSGAGGTGESGGDRGNGKGGRRGWRAGSIPMAWAATVMVAVGAGWMARQVTISSEFGELARRPAAEAPLEPVSSGAEAAADLDGVARARGLPEGAAEPSADQRAELAAQESRDRLQVKVDDEVAGRRVNEEVFADNRELPSDAAAGLPDAAEQRAAAKSVVLVEGEAAEGDVVAQAGADAERNAPERQVAAMGALAAAPPAGAAAAAGHVALGCYSLEASGDPAGSLTVPGRVQLLASAVGAEESRGDYYRHAGDGPVYEAKPGELGDDADRAADVATEDAAAAYWVPFGADSLLIVVAGADSRTVLRLRISGEELDGVAYAPGEARSLGAVRGRRIDCPATD